MQLYKTPVDVANRALQHVGVRRIGDFNDDSKQASEVSFVYDKLRRAELERNTWRFSIKHATLRPIGGGTMLVHPSLWSNVLTYYAGHIATLSDGSIWQAITSPNSNAEPDESTEWRAYYGPLTADPFDPTQTYYSGELAYQYAGDGTYQVYVSLQQQNAEDPSVPDQWLATSTYNAGDVVQFALPYASGTTYGQGAMVSLNGVVYISIATGNTGHSPDTDAGVHWILYPVPAVVPQPTISEVSVIHEWSNTGSYSLGSVIAYNAVQYMALQAMTSANPQVPSSSPTYWVAVSNAAFYQSIINLNENNAPSSSPAAFNAGVTYASAAQVVASNGYIYTSLANGNVGFNPVTDAGVHWQFTNTLAAWTSTFLEGRTSPTGSAIWRKIDAALSKIDFVYPIGAGPSYQAATRNVYRLPNNYLRHAPQDPKAGSASYLGAPSGRMYDDWDFEGNYIVSRESQPIVLRFAADIVNVFEMTDMFCEGLAARIAIAVCEPLTQSVEKITKCEEIYKGVMTEARLVNGIETGATEPPLDDYIACRI